jgi:hypothetical protein
VAYSEGRWQRGEPICGKVSSILIEVFEKKVPTTPPNFRTIQKNLTPVKKFLDTPLV